MARRADGRVRAERQSAQSKLYAQAGRRPLCRLSPFSLVVLCLMRASISRALAAPCSSKAEPHSRPSCRSDDMAAERAAAPGVAAVWVAFGPGFACSRSRSVGRSAPRFAAALPPHPQSYTCLHTPRFRSPGPPGSAPAIQRLWCAAASSVPWPCIAFQGGRERLPHHQQRRLSSFGFLCGTRSSASCCGCAFRFCSACSCCHA